MLITWLYYHTYDLSFYEIIYSNRVRYNVLLLISFIHYNIVYELLIIPFEGYHYMYEFKSQFLQHNNYNYITFNKGIAFIG